MRDPDRVAGLIIRDKKLLLVTGHEASYFWTPGGKIDEGESHEVALRREIKEELGVTISDIAFYMSLERTNSNSNNLQKSYYYLVVMEGDPVPSEEITDYKFFDGRELHNATPSVRDSIFPKLLIDKLVV